MAAVRQADIDHAVAILRGGGLVAFPTETVYGLGADAMNAAAVRKLYAVKRRPADHPLIVHLADAGQLAHWARDIPTVAKKLAQHFWPGPLTLLLKRQPHVGDFITGGQDTIGLRVPAHPLAQALLKAFNAGIAAPSANRFGHVSPTTAAHVRQEFGDAVACVLDGGPSAVGIESTILDVTRDVPVILRPGQISAAQIAQVLGVMPIMPALAGAGAAHDADMTGMPRVSGSLPAHYAPRTPLRIVPAAQLMAEWQKEMQHQRIAVLARAVASPAHLQNGCWRVAPQDNAGYAHTLYANLRALDDAQYDVIWVEQPPQTAEWAGVNDRLRRAAAATAMPASNKPEQHLRGDDDE